LILLVTYFVSSASYKCPDQVFVYDYQSVMQYSKKAGEKPTATTYRAKVEITCAKKFRFDKDDVLYIIIKFISVDQIQNGETVSLNKDVVGSFGAFMIGLNGEVAKVWYSKGDPQFILTIKKKQLSHSFKQNFLVNQEQKKHNKELL